MEFVATIWQMATGFGYWTRVVHAQQAKAFLQIPGYPSPQWPVALPSSGILWTPYQEVNIECVGAMDSPLARQAMPS